MTDILHDDRGIPAPDADPGRLDGGSGGPGPPVGGGGRRSDGGRDRDDPEGPGTARAGRPRVRWSTVAAVAAAPTRVVVAVGVESRETITGRTSAATADALGLPLTEFPSHHGGFLGNEHGQGGEPRQHCPHRPAPDQQTQQG